MRNQMIGIAMSPIIKRYYVGRSGKQVALETQELALIHQSVRSWVQRGAITRGRHMFPTAENIYSALVKGGAMLGGSDGSKLSERARTISEPLSANCAIAQIDSRGREPNCAVRHSQIEGASGSSGSDKMVSASLMHSLIRCSNLFADSVSLRADCEPNQTVVHTQRADEFCSSWIERYKSACKVNSHSDRLLPPGIY
jgi:hypothetical protein